MQCGSSEESELAVYSSFRNTFANYSILQLYNKKKLPIDSSIAMDEIMLNSPEMRRKHCLQNYNVCNVFRANIFLNRVSEDTISHFSSVGIKALFDDPRAYNKQNFPVNLTPLPTDKCVSSSNIPSHFRGNNVYY